MQSSMLKKTTILFFIILLLISCLFIYFKNENSVEINANYINFYVKNKISKIFTNSDVGIQDTSIIWQKKDSYLTITDLIIVNPNFTIKIPKLFIHFKLSALFKTHTNFSQIVADNIHVYIKPNLVIPVH